MPDLLTEPDWTGLTEPDRLDYDEMRVDYHTRLAAVATSTLRQVVHTGRRLTLLNRHAVSARRGLILSGAAGTGKTTAITQFGKTHQAIDRQRHPGVDDRIPFIYITVPPAATPRMVAAEFARFLGLPFTTRANWGSPRTVDIEGGLPGGLDERMFTRTGPPVRAEKAGGLGWSTARCGPRRSPCRPPDTGPLQMSLAG